MEPVVELAPDRHSLGKLGVRFALDNKAIAILLLINIPMGM